MPSSFPRRSRAPEIVVGPASTASCVAPWFPPIQRAATATTLNSRTPSNIFLFKLILVPDFDLASASPGRSAQLNKRIWDPTLFLSRSFNSCSFSLTFSLA